MRNVKKKRRNGLFFEFELCSAALTGSVPGKEASKKDTRELGGAENRTDEPENSLELELI